MTASRARPALIVWLLAILAVVVSGWVLLPFPRPPTGWQEIAWTIGFGVGFTSVGAVLVDRRPREEVSRITFGVGLAVVLVVMLRALAVALDARPGPLPPLGALAAVAARGIQALVFLAATTFLLVRFPNGRERDRLSGATDALLAVIVIAAVVQALTSGPIGVAWLSTALNPIGISPIDPGVVSAIAFVAYGVSLGLTVIVLLRRYRRSDPVTRAQIRWVVAAGSLPVLLMPLLFVFEWMWTVWLLSPTLLPIAIGFAILRYRLYEIDRIIGRTLAYALVTALLATVFVGTNLLLQTIVSRAVGQSTLTVAASTLFVAALFQPIRRWVQAPIDRRFNRSHLDAERVVGALSLRIRDEVDLARLRAAVAGAAVEAVRPSGVDIWLRTERQAR